VAWPPQCPKQALGEIVGSVDSRCRGLFTALTSAHVFGQYVEPGSEDRSVQHRDERSEQGTGVDGRIGQWESGGG